LRLIDFGKSYGNIKVPDAKVDIEFKWSDGKFCIQISEPIKDATKNSGWSEPQSHHIRQLQMDDSQAALFFQKGIKCFKEGE